MSDERVACDACDGDGGYVALACNRKTSRVVRIDCPTCGGTGKLSPVAAELRRRGEDLRARRVAANESLRATAARFGIPVGELAEVERGAAPRMLLERLEALWRS